MYMCKGDRSTNNNVFQRVTQSTGKVDAHFPYYSAVMLIFQSNFYCAFSFNLKTWPHWTSYVSVDARSVLENGYATDVWCGLYRYKSMVGHYKRQR